MDHASASFTSPWAAAVLSQHAMNPTNIEHGFGHHGLTMDYSYYRCGWIEHNFFVSCSSSPSSSPHLTLSRHHKKKWWQQQSESRLNSKARAKFSLWTKNEIFFKIIYVMCLLFGSVTVFVSFFIHYLQVESKQLNSSRFRWCLWCFE